MRGTMPARPRRRWAMKARRNSGGNSKGFLEPRRRRKPQTSGRGSRQGERRPGIAGRRRAEGSWARTSEGGGGAGENAAELGKSSAELFYEAQERRAYS